MSHNGVSVMSSNRDFRWRLLAGVLSAVCWLSTTGAPLASAQSLAADSAVTTGTRSPVERAAIRDATAQIARALEQREAAWLSVAYGLRAGVGAPGWRAITQARAGGARLIVEEVSEPNVLERGDVVRFGVVVRLRWVSPIGRTQRAQFRVVASCVQEGPRCTVLDLETHDQP